MLRKHYFVKPKSQICYLYLLFFVLVSCFLISYHVFLKFLAQNFAPVTQEYAVLISTFTKTFFVMAGISILVILVVSVFYFHRIVGPIFFFEKVMAQLKDGNLSVDVHHRKKDATIDLAKKISYAVTSIRVAVLEDRKKLEAIKVALDNGKIDEAKQILPTVTQWFKIEEEKEENK